MARATQLKKPVRRRIVGGVDTHHDTHHAAVLLMNGRRLADAEFATTEQGYAQLLAWLGSFGRLHAVGVEGTGSYGAGLTRHLHGAGVRVVEVTRPDRQQRRLRGKSDPLDAYAAAEAVLAGRATAMPKLGTGVVEAIRALHTTRASAVKTRTLTINQPRRAAGHRSRRVARPVPRPGPNRADRRVRPAAPHQRAGRPHPGHQGRPARPAPAAIKPYPQRSATSKTIYAPCSPRPARSCWRCTASVSKPPPNS